MWQRLPVVVRAVIAGFLVSSFGVVPWGGIAGFRGIADWNLRVMPQVPWTILPMGLYLFL